MGCDIHVYREKKVDGKWVSADEWESYSEEDGGHKDVPFGSTFHERNYDLFAVLAGVRERGKPAYSFTPRGMPVTCSQEVLSACKSWDCDGHSHSYLYLTELQDLNSFMESEQQIISGMKNKQEIEELNKSIASGSPEWSLIYPYCQGTTDKTYEHFSVAVPANYIIGDAIKRLIASIDSIGGECQRIVFWFDN